MFASCYSCLNVVCVVSHFFLLYRTPFKRFFTNKQRCCNCGSVICANCCSQSVEVEAMNSETPSNSPFDVVYCVCIVCVNRTHTEQRRLRFAITAILVSQKKERGKT